MPYSYVNEAGTGQRLPQLQGRCNFFFPHIPVHTISRVQKFTPNYRTIASNADRKLLVVIGGHCNYWQLCTVREAPNLPYGIWN